MTEGYRGNCLCKVGRLENEGLCTLLAHVLNGDRGAVRRLSSKVTPLLVAFYEGQAQVGRIRHENVEYLTHEAFLAVLENAAGYDAATPFRAWLLQIARTTLLGYLPANDATSLLSSPHIQWAI
ncbi:hypothetical protein LVW35_09860 [Pseudomonas sp. HN11]|uniref:sigma factor n=1 Tax=Pseudomonas sp. HN11 TaxID=1344094 RepID=UPI001F1DE0FC|nr:sigma factor [Pseudomonas sp. HN11]UII73446.1 hypothetical protein LVW35_09860 [Pseudomonas sp. HN11]